MKQCLLLFLFAGLLSMQACDDGDAPQKTTIDGFTLSNTSIDEGSTTAQRSFTIQVDGEVHSDVTVTYTIQEQTAKFGKDLETASGEFELTHNDPDAQISIPIIGDEDFELSETFNIVLTYNSQEYPVTVTIRDDDPIPQTILEDANGFYTPDSYPSMTLAWADEFGGTELNASNWTYEIGNGCPNICGWGNNELEVYTNSADNSKVETGTLTITAIEDNGAYTSARIKTQGKVKPTF